MLPAINAKPEKSSIIKTGWIFFVDSCDWLWNSVKNGYLWFILEFRYWLRLFIFTSKRLLRIELLLAIFGAILFFGIIISKDMARSQQTMLEQMYLFFTAIMVLFSMNVIPKEKEEGTLEILWSQPISRNKLIILQLSTLTAWTFVLSLVFLFSINHFSAYQEKYFLVMTILITTTSFTTGAITILVSTFCRQAIATGLVSLLILGIHYFWLKDIGPINLFYNPIPLPAEEFQKGLKIAGQGFQDISQNTGSSGWMLLLNMFFLFNRLFTLMVAGFVLDYLFRRLRRTAEWFT